MHETRWSTNPVPFLILFAGAAATAAPMSIPVDCAAGQTVGAALVTARATLEPVTIRISGTCKERVLVDRDGIQLLGVDASAGFDGGGLAGPSAVVAVNARRVVLDSLTIWAGGKAGLDVYPGATASARRLQVREADDGISLLQGAFLDMWRSSVSDSRGGGILGRNASLALAECSVERSASVGIGLSAGSLDMRTSKVIENTLWGISLTDNAVAIVSGSSFDDNQIGLYLQGGARALVGSTTISGSRSWGVRLSDQSSVLLGTGAVVEGNGAAGVYAAGNSVVAPQRATIKNNAGDGITVADTSLVTSVTATPPTITANAGYGVACEGHPGDARLASPGFGVAAVFGNTAGQLRCPGYVR